MESANILRSYYDSIWQPFIQSPEHLQEVSGLVEMLENQIIGPKQLIEVLYELKKTDPSIDSYLERILLRWDRRINELDSTRRNPLMLVDATNSKECAELLEILSLVMPMTQFEVLIHIDSHGQSLFEKHQNHPQLITGLLECMEGFPDYFKVAVLNTYTAHHYGTIFTGALRGNHSYLPAFIEMINRFRGVDKLEQSLMSSIYTNPLEVALETNPVFVPALLKIMARVNSDLCFKILASVVRAGVSVFARIMDLKSPEAMAELIPILKNVLDQQAKINLFMGGPGPWVLPNMNYHPDWLLATMMTYIADDESLPEFILFNLINSISIEQINNNLASFLLIFSRINPLAQDSTLNMIMNADGVEHVELIELHKDCLNFESLIGSSNQSINTLLIRAASLSNSPASLPYLLTFISTAFQEHLIDFLLASNEAGDTALMVAARCNHPAIEPLLRAIEGYDHGKRYDILSRSNHKGETALTIAMQSQYQEVERLRKLTENSREVIISYYQPNLNLFKPAPDESSTGLLFNASASTMERRMN